MDIFILLTDMRHIGGTTQFGNIAFPRSGPESGSIEGSYVPEDTWFDIYREGIAVVLILPQALLVDPV